MAKYYHNLKGCYLVDGYESSNHSKHLQVTCIKGKLHEVIDHYLNGICIMEGIGTKKLCEFKDGTIMYVVINPIEYKHGYLLPTIGGLLFAPECGEIDRALLNARNLKISLAT